MEGLLNRWLSGEELDEEEREVVREAWRVLFRSEEGMEYKSVRRVSILSDVVRYAVKRLGAYEVDWLVLIVEFMDGIVWKCFEDSDEHGEVQESEIWMDGEECDEDGEEVGEEG